MGWLLFAPVLVILILLCCFRFHLLSLYNYILARLELRRWDFRLLSSLRDDLIHERKKKTAGLEMILSSWERGDEIQPRYEYFEELVDQLKALVKAQRRNMMVVTNDVWLWAKLWNTLRKVEKTLAEEREKSDVSELRNNLTRFQKLLDQTVIEATDKLSFTLNEILGESVKTVRMEKSELTGVAVKVELDQIGNTIRLSYDKSREWQRILTNLIRNAIEAVEAKQSGAGSVVADLGLPGGEKNYWVKIRTTQSDTSSVSVIVEDSGIGMDEVTRSSFYKKGFTLGKESGLGLGITEESVDLINRFGTWEIESRKGIGTKITISIDKEKARKAQLFAPEEKQFSRIKLVLVLSIPLVVVIGLILLFVFDKYSRFWVDWNPMSAKVVDENRVVAEAKDGSFLWVRSFLQKVRETCVVVADIDKDGRNEVLIGTMKASKETGNLFCFSYRGNELWRFALGADHIFQVPSNRYNCCSIIAKDLNSDGETEILAEATNTPWFPHQIALLDIRGQLKSSYWHSGSISLLLCDDIDDDGIQDIIFGGVNNRLQYSAVLGILDHDHNWGQSPPYRDTILAKAKETIYVKFPFVRGLGGKNDRYSNVLAFMYAGRENDSDVYHVTITDDPGFQREYHMDKGLTHVKDVIVHPDYRFIWEKLKKDGMVDYELSPEVLESWKEIEVWKNGVKVK